MPTEHLTLARLVLSLMLAALAACDPGKKEQAPPTVQAAGAPLRVDVDDHGFQPSRVQIPPNQPVKLLFHRSSESTCATSVVFPELKLERELPLHKEIQVDLPPLPSGKELVFQCGMGMYKSKVVAR